MPPSLFVCSLPFCPNRGSPEGVTSLCCQAPLARSWQLFMDGPALFFVETRGQGGHAGELHAEQVESTGQWGCSCQRPGCPRVYWAGGTKAPLLPSQGSTPRTPPLPRRHLKKERSMGRGSFGACLHDPQNLWAFGGWPGAPRDRKTLEAELVFSFRTRPKPCSPSEVWPLRSREEATISEHSVAIISWNIQAAICQQGFLLIHSATHGAACWNLAEKKIK